MAERKVNSNGPAPGSPQDERPASQTLDSVMQAEAADADLRDRERTRREGMCCDYTKAPWRMGS